VTSVIAARLACLPSRPEASALPPKKAEIEEPVGRGDVGFDDLDVGLDLERGRRTRAAAVRGWRVPPACLAEGDRRSGAGEQALEQQRGVRRQLQPLQRRRVAVEEAGDLDDHWWRPARSRVHVAGKARPEAGHQPIGIGCGRRDGESRRRRLQIEPR